MRIVSMIAVLIAIFLMISVENTQADSMNTKINMSTEIQNNTIESDPFLMSLFFQDIIQEKPQEVIRTEEEIRYENTLNKWKAKQSHLWNQLPKEPFTINASAYTAAADECGKSDGITASGIKVQEKRTLACPAQYPFGAKLKIDGFGVFTCEDRGGAIKGNRFDIYMETKKDAFAFGRRHLTAEVIQ